MNKSLTLAAMMLLACAGSAMAQSSDPVVNSHSVYSAKLKACRKAAADRGVTGEERREAVSACMKSSDQPAQ